MKAIEILDKYKSSVMNNKHYSEILAYAYYKGNCEEGEIAKDLQINISTVFRLVQELYKDGFLKKTGEYLRVTNKTISLLEEFGFGNMTSNMLLSDEIESKRDYAFLKAYCHSDLNKNKSMPTTISLRNMKNTLNSLQIKVDKSTKQEIVWAIIVGPDELLQATNKEVFVQKILNYHKINHTIIWQEDFEILQDNVEYYVLNCGNSKRAFNKNNEIIADYKQKIDKYYDILYNVRLMNCLVDGVIDNDLHSIWHVDTKTIETSLRKLVVNNYEFYFKYSDYIKSHIDKNQVFKLNYFNRNFLAQRNEEKSSVSTIIENIVTMIRLMFNFYH